MLDVTEDIRNKVIWEQSIHFAFQIIVRSMASGLVFSDMGAHIVERNISKIYIVMILWENHGIEVCPKEFFQDNLCPSYESL